MPWPSARRSADADEPSFVGSGTIAQRRLRFRRKNLDFDPRFRARFLLGGFRQRGQGQFVKTEAMHSLRQRKEGLHRMIGRLENFLEVLFRQRTIRALSPLFQHDFQPGIAAAGFRLEIDGAGQRLECLRVLPASPVAVVKKVHQRIFRVLPDGCLDQLIRLHPVQFLKNSDEHRLGAGIIGILGNMGPIKPDQLLDSVRFLIEADQAVDRSLQGWVVVQGGAQGQGLLTETRLVGRRSIRRRTRFFLGAKGRLENSGHNPPREPCCENKARGRALETVGRCRQNVSRKWGHAAA